MLRSTEMRSVPLMGGVFDEPADDGPAEVERRRHRPMEVDSSRYYETGRLAVATGADGLPVMGGEHPPPPDKGWSEENFVCAGVEGRPRCRFYGAILLPADGVARGYGEMRQIRRFCKWLGTASEPFEIDDNIYGCLMRDPPDEGATKALTDFEAKQRQVAKDSAETSGEMDF